MNGIAWTPSGFDLESHPVGFDSFLTRQFKPPGRQSGPERTSERFVHRAYPMLRQVVIEIGGTVMVDGNG